MNTINLLSHLGWKPFFQQQLSLEDWECYYPVRVCAHHRSHYQLMGENGRFNLAMNPNFPPICVGDWLLVDNEKRFVRLLQRSSLLSRKAAGSQLQQQLITANLDTLFIVSSLNQDFNLSRIERYLSIANQAGIEKVLVLTKSDLCQDPEPFLEQVKAIDPMLWVETVNALEASSVEVLSTWLAMGQSIALLGSSGVGKSTLLNTILQEGRQNTAAIREDDEKGRHTTTARSLHLIPNAGVVIDTPGMRELQLADCETGVRQTFADIEALAASCRFSDCQHQSEPGCAVQQAIRDGALEQRRLSSYHKVLSQQSFNALGLAEKRAKDRELGRFYRSVKNSHRKYKNSI